VGDKVHVLYKVRQIDVTSGQRVETTKALCSGEDANDGILSRNARKLSYETLRDLYCACCAARVS
jgi:hypothetical protein